MVTATISNISEKIIPSKAYQAEELLQLLMKALDYNIEINNFSIEENNELMKDSRIDEISSLID